jgi:colanic acid/amylovoran biosynthesis protein
MEVGMIRVLIVNNGGCQNRGCQALNRSIVTLFSDQIREAIEFMIFTRTPNYDQECMAEFKNVRFIRYPESLAKIKFLSYFNIPGFRRIIRALSATLKLILSSNIVISSGGDTLTCDYSSKSLKYHFDFLSLAKRMGKPVFILGATLGPYTEKMARFAKEVLSRVDAISVRETATFKYLKSLGLTTPVFLTADPAFLLATKPVDWWKGFSSGSQKTVGISISDGIIRYSGLDDRRHCQTYVDFINALTEEDGHNVVLIPHVFANSEAGPDDRKICERIYKSCRRKDKIVYANFDLDSSEVKYLIGQCDAFIGERTHATIASLSNLVPTLSISYSAKALGINQDVFDHLNYVIDAKKLTSQLLREKTNDMLNKKGQISRFLAERIGLIKRRARENVRIFEQLIGRNPHERPA